MRFACFRNGLRADAVFRADKGKEVPEFGRVDHNRRTEPERRSALEMNRRNGDDAITVGLSGRHFCSQMQGEPARLEYAVEQRIHGGDAPPSARKRRGVTQQLPGLKSGAHRHRPQAAVVVAQRIAQVVVARSAPESLDVIVLVQRRNALRGELATEPVGLLDE